MMRILTLLLFIGTGFAEPVLSGEPAQHAGDPVMGKAVFLDRSTGHCLLCHSVKQIAEPSQGTLGPALDDVGNRLSADQLRVRISDGTRLNPDTAMPAYFRQAPLNRVAAEYVDKTVLTEQEVEDLVAYLLTLKSAP